MKILLVSSFLIYLVASQVPTFSTQYSYVVDVCVNNTGDSSIFRCSDYALWKFTYPYSETCSGYGYVSAMYQGCDESDNTFYDIIGCSAAQANAGANCAYIVISGEPIPLGVCRNSASTTSYYYTCVTDSIVSRYTYSQADCGGNATATLNYSSASYEIHCGTNNCSATATKYTTSLTCSYDGIKTQPGDPSSKSCRYFIDDSNDANAIDVCFSGRAGYELYSSMYTCTTSGDVQLWYWLDSDSCDGTKFLASTYTSSNYTINCGGSKCSHKIRYYEDCNYQNVYTEVPVVWNQCFKYYDGNQTGDVGSYNDALYYMNTCVDGYAAVFYYTDSECTDANVFTISNTSTSGCDYILTGCTNSNSPGYLAMPMSFYSVIVMVIAMVVPYVQ